jgi:hypothetical protein
MLTTLDKTIYQEEEVIITGYDNASGMEFRAGRIHPLWVKTLKFKEN